MILTATDPSLAPCLSPSATPAYRALRPKRPKPGHTAPGRLGSKANQQRSGTGSSGDQAPDTRKPAFSLVLGSLAHDRRLRSDSYDPQRPGVRKRAGCEGRSTPLLHSWFVQRGDGLILRTLSPNFALTPKLQHYLPIVLVALSRNIDAHMGFLQSPESVIRVD